MAEVTKDKLLEHLLGAMELLKKLQARREEENSWIEEFMKKVLASISEDEKKEDAGGESDKKEDPAKSAGEKEDDKAARALKEMMKYMEEKTMKEKEAAMKREKKIIEEVMEKKRAEKLAKIGISMPSSPSVKEKAEALAEEMSDMEANGSTLGGKPGFTEPTDEKIIAPDGSHESGKGRVFCSVCNEYHDKAH